VNLNKIANTLDFYDLRIGTLSHRIVLYDPQLFGNYTPQGFYFHNIDSIFIFPQMTLNGSILINIEGELQKKYLLSIPDESEHPLALNHISSPSSPTKYLQGKINASIATLNSFSHGKGVEPGTKLILDADLINENISIRKDIIYPSAYHFQYVTNHHAFLTRELVKNQFWVHSFPLLDSLDIFDIEYNFLYKKYAKSKFFDKFISVPINTPVQQYNKYITSESSYGRIIYDAYRNIYYRFVLVGRPVNDAEIEGFNSSRKNQFSIIVLDKDFIIIDEVLFPGGIYNQYAAFVGKLGLYLPKTNENYEELSEDYITYDIFNFN
jgi:hypothetical protein